MQWKAVSNPGGREKVAQGPPEPGVSNFLEPDFSAARSCLCTEQPKLYQPSRPWNCRFCWLADCLSTGQRVPCCQLSSTNSCKTCHTG